MAGLRAVKAKMMHLRTNIRKLATDSVVETKETLLALNKEQLLEGKNKYGLDLAPTYLDDPYFKSREAAQRYSDWKDRITPNPKRKKGVPNLFIVGTYHNSIEATLQGNKLEVTASFSQAKSIENKYTGLYGLSAPFKQRYIETDVRPLLYNKIRTSLKSA
jgi:hypothetical protein